MLESITLKFTQLAEPLVVPTQGVTVFVGPNNSGKSLVLKEVEEHFQHHEKFTTKIVEDFKIIWPTEEHASEDIESLSQKHPHNREGYFYLGRYSPAGELEQVEHQQEQLDRSFQRPAKLSLDCITVLSVFHDPSGWPHAFQLNQ